MTPTHTPLDRLVAVIRRVGAETVDSEDARLQKTLLVGASLMFTPGGPAVGRYLYCVRRTTGRSGATILCGGFALQHPLIRPDTSLPAVPGESIAAHSDSPVSAATGPGWICQFKRRDTMVTDMPIWCAADRAAPPRPPGGFWPSWAWSSSAV